MIKNKENTMQNSGVGQIYQYVSEEKMYTFEEMMAESQVPKTENYKNHEKKYRHATISKFFSRLLCVPKKRNQYDL
jgi:hypothetical protein